jgi:Ca2+-transporting ATPase
MSLDDAWYRRSEADALAALGSTPAGGLSGSEAQARRQRSGFNSIEDAKRRGPWSILIAQFTDLFVLVLIAAAVIAGFLGEPQDIVAIVAIVVLNAGLGFVQEYRAERAIEALKVLAAPQARVRREGHDVRLPARELVPGDIVLLEAGNIVPADLRIIEAASLHADESMLTGESQPVEKQTAALAPLELPVAEQRNMAFMGTLVTAGRATGLAVRTGMETELGRVARLIQGVEEPRTPLQNRIARFAQWLSAIVLLLCAAIFLAGLARGEPPVLMFITALSLAVAAVPEALPAVVTVSLAIGLRLLSRRNALVRKLPAVEALGSVTVICTDKTGTLTENRMRLQGLYVRGTLWPSIPAQAPADPAWTAALRILALCNDVTADAQGRLQGDPTETALVQAAQAAGWDKAELEKALPRIAELPFSSERGLMSTVHRTAEGDWVFAKGAPEKLLPFCRWSDGPAGLAALNPDTAQAAMEAMAGGGMRVLALAYRKLPSQAAPRAAGDWERDLVFAGFAGLMDPPRPEAGEAVSRCHAAGIRVVMVTGDHPATARAIAARLGISAGGAQDVVTGQQLLGMSDAVLQARARQVTIYARTAPEQKIRIVKALQAAGEVVAMTGDGVNDAPALKRADIGVSMGRGGTDVAREASHMVLLDDNFATIVAAVREGRRIHDNIRKFIRYTLSGNSGEIWTLFAAPFLGLPLPLLPIHILWVNLVTDGLPGAALALEPEERDILRRPPRPPQEGLFARGLWQHAVWAGVFIAAATLGTQAWAYHTGHAPWRSMAFTVLTLSQLAHVMAIRSERASLFDVGLRSNPVLLVTVLATLGVHLAVLYVPLLNSLLKTEPLTWQELAICGAVSSTVFFAVECEKWLRRRSHPEDEERGEGERI